MMAYLTAHAPASRRAFSPPSALYQGDIPDYARGGGGRGNPGDEYITSYPMKKSRSHTSIAQAAADCSLEEGSCGGYVIASAPENAICVVDTDGDDGCFVEETGAELGSSSACDVCGGGGGARSGYSIVAALEPPSSSFSLSGLQPRSGSYSSSAMLSSPSGASTPLLSGPGAPALALPLGKQPQPQAQPHPQPGAHPQGPSLRSQPPAAQPGKQQQRQQGEEEEQQRHQHQEWERDGLVDPDACQPGRCDSTCGRRAGGALRVSGDGRATSWTACAAAFAAASAQGSRNLEGEGCDSDRATGCGADGPSFFGAHRPSDSGADFMGAFGVLTEEQWESLQCAIGGGAAPAPPAAAAAGPTAAPARRSSCGSEAGGALAPPVTAAPPPAPGARTSSHGGSGPSRNGCSNDGAPGGGGAGSGGDPDSAQSIASLWAAVDAAAAASSSSAAANATVSSAGGVLGGTDAAAAGGGGGWGGLRPPTLPAIRAAPAVPPTRTSPLRFESQPGRYPPPQQRPGPHSAAAQRHGDHGEPFAFHHSYYSGGPYGGGRMAAALAAASASVSVAEQPGSPGSPAVRPSGNSFGVLIDAGVGGLIDDGVLVRQRSRTLEGYTSASASGGGAAAAAVAGAAVGCPPASIAYNPRASLDSTVGFSYHDRGTSQLQQHHGGGGGAAAAAGYYYSAYRQGAASEAAAAEPPPPPTSHFSTGHALQTHYHQRLPPPPSYTTYGYRRARSSLAALEQSGPDGGHGSGGGGAGGGGGADDSSSDDDTEEATRRITAAFRTHTGMTRSSGWGLLGTDSAPTTPTGEAGRRDPWAGSQHSNTSRSLGAASEGDGGGAGKEGGEADGEGDGGAALARKRSSYHLTNSHAAVELFLRLNHARQTMDFVKRQTQLFASLDKAQLSVWEALALLDELREYEAVLMADGTEAQDIASLSLLEHAFQTAELCRLHHPELDWLHLVGLIHGLGKLLAHRRFGSQPQWAICGETFPLGCRFSPHILGSTYFTANPDRRRRLYNSPTGIYGLGAGMLNVVMSWSAPEYLYLVLLLNRAPLPEDALWVLRHAKFASLTRPHSCYLPLCCPDDLRRLPLLRSFQQLAAFRRAELPPGFALSGDARHNYYSGLVAKYIGPGQLHW